MRYTSQTRSARRAFRTGCKRSLDDSDSEPSEHSSDSGLGLDHLTEVQLATRSPNVHKRFALPFDDDEADINDDYCFPVMPGRGRGAAGLPATAVPLSATLPSATRDGSVNLAIICQPEQQHRARYQTEGSRGAVKDRTGHGFPVVKLAGYNKPTTMQIFVGTDIGRVVPHMFYQACRVSGKNSTPCVERKIDGTVVIEVDLDASKDMVVTCDCVGILKERNVDVEHRFPDQSATRNKKKSTRCRLVFRTSVINDDGLVEVLQVCSQPIVCTQPPGIPEISKRSSSSCSATGGSELIILGKNFLKDTKVIFQDAKNPSSWEEVVTPDKEFLQQNHLVCIVPPYKSEINEAISTKMFVVSGGKTSDPQNFIYLPSISSEQLVPTSPPGNAQSPFYMDQTAYINGERIMPKRCNVAGPSPKSSSPLSSSSSSSLLSPSAGSNLLPTSITPFDVKPDLWKEEIPVMMPPPPALIPLVSSRHTQLDELKAELEEELSQHSAMETESDISPLSSESQGVDLTLQKSLLASDDITSHAINAFSFLKVETPPKSFSVLYDGVPQTIIEEQILQPPPHKILAREFPSVLSSSAMSSPPPPPRARSGSFSDSRASSLEVLSRNRSASISHSSFNRGKLFSSSPPTPIPFLNDVNLVEKTMTNGVNEAVQVLQPQFFATSSSTPTVSSPTTPAMLDALVNSAADSHMNQLIVPAVSPTAVSNVREIEVPVAVPITVNEISRNTVQMMTEMGQAAPSLPQEITKMTENDLISYINPSCFDQV